MYKPITPEEISFDNTDFWWYYLKYGFWGAADYEKEMNFDEVLDQMGYLTQSSYTGRYILVPVNAWLEASIEFRPEETVYFLNDFNIGSHGEVSQALFLTWHEIERFAAAEKGGKALFWLFLPMTAIAASARDAAQEKISAHLRDLPIKPEHGPYFAERIAESLLADDACFAADPAAGTICRAPHSLRDPAKFKDEEDRKKLADINKLLAKLTGG